MEKGSPERKFPLTHVRVHVLLGIAVVGSVYDVGQSTILREQEMVSQQVVFARAAFNICVVVKQLICHRK